MKLYIATIIPKEAQERAVLAGRVRKQGKEGHILSTKYRVSGQKVMASSSLEYLEEWAEENSTPNDRITINRWKGMKSK